MTTLYEEAIKCAACGSESEHTIVGSTNAFGSSDLDTRPPEMKRSTMDTWVQRCPACGYCAPNIGTAAPEFKAIIDSAEYREQLHRPDYPGLANSFLCKAIIEREEGKYSAATWSQIFAAWTCDDWDAADAATTCRRSAAEMFARAEAAGQAVGQPAHAGKAILVDLLRRSGQISRAREVIKVARQSIPDEIILSVLDYQEKLIARQDISCHTIAEAVDGAVRRQQMQGKEEDDDVPF